MSMADQVILLREGRIEQDAAPADLYAQPATAFAARFIGTPPMNLLPAALIGGADGLVAGIRPEALSVGTEGIPLRMIVAHREYLGGDTVLTGTAHGAPIQARLSGAVGATVGDIVPLSAPAEAFHWFDAATGRRVAQPAFTQEKIRCPT
jgi:sn-glycerol 3-phosphate transport system ATP-binding protein